jgi:hypothetical protein
MILDFKRNIFQINTIRIINMPTVSISVQCIQFQYSLIGLYIQNMLKAKKSSMDDIILNVCIFLNLQVYTQNVHEIRYFKIRQFTKL